MSFSLSCNIYGRRYSFVEKGRGRSEQGYRRRKAFGYERKSFHMSSSKKKPSSYIRDAEVRGKVASDNSYKWHKRNMPCGQHPATIYGWIPRLTYKKGPITVASSYYNHVSLSCGEEQILFPRWFRRWQNYCSRRWQSRSTVRQTSVASLHEKRAVITTLLWRSGAFSWVLNKKIDASWYQKNGVLGVIH